MPKAYGYLRLSHKLQADSGNSIETQRKIVWDKFERLRAIEPDLEWGGFITDMHVSAFKKRFQKRPGGHRLDRMLQAGDVVLFSRVDRAFRNLTDLHATTESWRDRGIRFEFMDLQFDLDSPMGKMFLAATGMFAELDSSMKSERIGLAVRRLKSAGVPLGRTPRGFKRFKPRSNPHKIQLPLEGTEELAAEIARLRESGLGFIAISDEIEDWLAAREKRESNRGIRSKYLWTTQACKTAYQRHCRESSGKNTGVVSE